MRTIFLLLLVLQWHAPQHHARPRAPHAPVQAPAPAPAPAPPAPANPGRQVLPLFDVDLWWSEDDGADPAVGYYVYRSEGGAFQRLNEFPVGAMVYVDELPDRSGAAFTYYVTSVDAGGTESAPSNVWTAVMP